MYRQNWKSLMLLFESNCNSLFLLVYRPQKRSYCTNRDSGLGLTAAMALCRIQTKEKIRGENYIFISFSRKTNDNI